MPLRPLIIFAALLILITSSTRTWGEDGIAPNWTSRTPEGVSVELAERGQEGPQIILFWATWCPYCNALMAHLQSIQLENARPWTTFGSHGSRLRSIDV